MTKQEYIEERAMLFNVRVEQYAKDMKEKFVVFSNRKDGYRYFKTLVNEDTAMVFGTIEDAKIYTECGDVIMSEKDYVNFFLELPKDEYPYIEPNEVEKVDGYTFYDYVAANYAVLTNKYYDAAREVRKAAIDYITKLVRKEGGRIDFDIENDSEYFSVSYDGGRHPEYDSNLYSTCHSVYLKDKGDSLRSEVVLEIEETDDYPEDNISTDDLIAVADAISAHIINKNKE